MSRKKKVFINASTVLISGGYYLAQNIIKALIIDNSFELVILCPDYKKFSSCISVNSHIRVVPQWLLKKIFRLILDNVWLPGIINKTNPDFILSLTNIPVKTNYPQIYLHDNPYFHEKNLRKINLTLKELLIQKIRSRITEKRLKYVNLIIVQSDFYKKRLVLLTEGKIPIHILTPSLSVNLDAHRPKGILSKRAKKFKILCLSRYFEHKNLEVLIKLGVLIKQGKYPFIIYLTLDNKHHKNVQNILNDIQKLDLDKIIFNLGEIPHKDITNHIYNCDAFILPSLLESFSFNYIEAWNSQKPLFISNTPANKSVCKNAAFYFDPFNEKDILNTLLNLQNPDKIKEMVKNGNERFNTLSGWNDYVTLLKNCQI